MSVAVTHYSGAFAIYGYFILQAISKLGNFRKSNFDLLLDYGCGSQELRKFSGNMEYIGFDLKPELRDVDSWTEINVHTIVINHVLMYLNEQEIIELFKQINQHHSIQQIIIGVGTQNLFSKIGKCLLQKNEAHNGTVSTYESQLRLIRANFRVIKRKSIFSATNIYLLEKRPAVVE